MKLSAVALIFAAVVAAQEPEPPAFLNTDYSLVEGEPFTLTFSGCEEGCTIILMNGPKGALVPVQDLTSSATGGEFTFTPDDLPSDEYAFRIVDNPSGLFNHSPQFDYEGIGEAPAPTTTEAEVTTTEAPETTNEVEETTTEEEAITTTEEEDEEETTTSTEVETTTFTTTTSEASPTTEASSTSEASTTTPEASSTSEASPTETGEATSSGDGQTEVTEPPNSGAGSLGRPMALVVCAVGAFLLLN